MLLARTPTIVEKLRWSDFFRYELFSDDCTRTKSILRTKALSESQHSRSAVVRRRFTGQRRTTTCLSAHVTQTLFDVINDYNRDVKREKMEPKKKTLALAVMVDDLDRCSKENVMEMLKATHLLLEQPTAPMVVFLAVDPQLVISAIAESFEGVPNTVSRGFTWLSFLGIPHAREHGRYS